MTAVAAVTGADGTAVVAGGSVARDRAVIPGRGVLVDVDGAGNGLLANDTGGAIRGYCLDLFNGASRGVWQHLSRECIEMNRRLSMITTALAAGTSLAALPPAAPAPSGMRIAAVRDGKVCVSLDGGVLQCFGPASSKARLPTWSRDGGRIAYIDEAEPGPATVPAPASSWLALGALLALAWVRPRVCQPAARSLCVGQG